MHIVRTATLLLSLFCASLTHATAQRTFVGASGTDNPNCSLVAPCRSFGAAITATSAGGEVIVLDSAGYGPVTITKAVSIIAPPGIYGGISVSPGFDGVTVNAGAGDKVVLRGLSINGQGGDIGVNVVQAGWLRIESCVIANMGTHGIVATGGTGLIVLDTIVRDNGGAGIRISPLTADVSALLDHVHSEHNGQHGLYVAPGVSSGPVEVSATIMDSIFAYNGGDGIHGGSATNGLVSLQVERSVMSNNGFAGLTVSPSLSGARTQVTLTRSAISGNAGDGVLISASLPATARGYLSENALHSNHGVGIHASGAGSLVSVSGNTATNNITGGLASLVCDGGSLLVSLANNNADSEGSSTGTCYITGPGF